MPTYRSSAFKMVPMDHAIELVHKAVDFVRENYDFEEETISLSSASAIGRVLSADIVAPFDIPSRTCSRLDGYAVIAADKKGLYPVVQNRRVGHTSGELETQSICSGQVTYITTGAPLPPGADAVVGVEDTRIVESSEDALVEILIDVKIGNGTRPKGSDVGQGQILLSKHHQLSSTDVAMLLSCRILEISVYKTPKIGILSSGDELRDPLEESRMSSNLEADAIWDSNRKMLSSLICSTSGLGISLDRVTDFSIVRDNKEMVLDTLRSTIPLCDVLITTGGVSMGDRDYIKPCLQTLAYGELNEQQHRMIAETCADVFPELLKNFRNDKTGNGVHNCETRPISGGILFGRLNMKPGKPATACLLQSHEQGNNKPCLVFALPGNPVSAAVCFHVLVAPALRYLCGLSWEDSLPPVIPVETLTPLALDYERPELHRALVWSQQHGNKLTFPPSTTEKPGGKLVALSTGAQASSRLSSLSRANALLWLPQAGTDGPSGTWGPVLEKGSTVYAIMTAPIANKGEILSDADRIPPSSCSCTHYSVATGKGAARHSKDHHIGNESSRPQHNIEMDIAGKRKIRVGIVVVSDTAYHDSSLDKSGPAIQDYFCSLASISCQILPITYTPDSLASIKECLIRLCDNEECDLIITTGGTGFGVRDVTPEATKQVIHKSAPGFVFAMLNAGMTHTPMAILSRYEAGVRIRNQQVDSLDPVGPGTLIINTPGSPKAVLQSLNALQQALPHALSLLIGL